MKMLRKCQIVIFILTIIVTLEFIGLCNLYHNVKTHECEVDVVAEPVEELTMEEKIQDRTAQWVVNKYGENIIDIYFDDHEAANEFGLQYHKVYLKG